jgi:hypothetical protein
MHICDRIFAANPCTTPTGCDSLTLRVRAISITLFRYASVTEGQAWTHSSCHVTQRLFTDEDVWENDMASEIIAGAMEAKQMAAENGIALSDTTELVIERCKGGIGYYFVDHDAQILFWPQPVTSWKLMNDVKGVTEKSHISERGVCLAK